MGNEDIQLDDIDPFVGLLVSNQLANSVLQYKQQFIHSNPLFVTHALGITSEYDYAHKLHRELLYISTTSTTPYVFTNQSRDRHIFSIGDLL